MARVQPVTNFRGIVGAEGRVNFLLFALRDVELLEKDFPFVFREFPGLLPENGWTYISRDGTRADNFEQLLDCGEWPEQEEERLRNAHHYPVILVFGGNFEEFRPNEPHFLINLGDFGRNEQSRRNFLRAAADRLRDTGEFLDNFLQWCRDSLPGFLEAPLLGKPNDKDWIRRRVLTVQYVAREANQQGLNRKTCQKLDEDGVAIPKSWHKNHGVRSWIEAYDTPGTKNLVQKMLCDDRN